MARFVILQSGFLSVDIPDLIQSRLPTDVEKMQVIELNKPATSAGDSPYHYNSKVSDVVSAYRANNKLLREFDFREQVLKAAKDAFATKVFSNWCELQLHSPFLTAMHKRFIIDTLTYLDNGNRTVAIESWWELIEPRVTTEQDAKAEFVYTPMLHQMKTTTLLANWCDKDNGFSDLIQTLDVIFGKKAKHNGTWVQA